MLNLSNQRNDVHAERMGTRRTESAPRAVERLQISRVCKIYRSHSILLELETWTGGGGSQSDSAHPDTPDLRQSLI